MIPTRRNALILLASTAMPLKAIAQETAPPPAITPPTPPMQPPPITVPTPAHPSMPPAPAATLSPPHNPAPTPAAIDHTKRYFVFFDGAIDVNSMKALRRELTTLIEGGVEDILLSIHSPGGLIDPMLATYSFIRALPARIDTHATSFVMSAATTLFLAGENRSADHTARFLVHPSTVPVVGTLNGPQIQDRLNQYDVVDGVTRQILHDRTTLSDEQINRFNHEETYFTADQALTNGIVQTVKDLHIPGPDKARIVFVD
jgi:ATP-dependent Clp protease protease subunit